MAAPPVEDEDKPPCPTNVYMQVGYDYLAKGQFEKAIKSFEEVSCILAAHTCCCGVRAASASSMTFEKKKKKNMNFFVFEMKHNVFSTSITLL